jgi:hypothetical protein
MYPLNKGRGPITWTRQEERVRQRYMRLSDGAKNFEGHP